MARSSATTAGAARVVAAATLLLVVVVLSSSSTARAEDIHYCTVNLVSYVPTTTLFVYLYDGNPDSCDSEPGVGYRVSPPVDGKAADVPGQCEDPYECAVQVGDNGECIFNVVCGTTMVFYDGASGAVQYCFGPNCYVPPRSAITISHDDPSTRSLLRGGER